MEDKQKTDKKGGGKEQVNKGNTLREKIQKTQTNKQLQRNKFERQR